VGSIHGGTKHNILPDEVRLQLTLRSYKPETRAQLVASVKRIVKSCAEMANMPADKMPEVIVSEEGASALYNAPSLASVVRSSLEATLGADKVITSEPIMGAEDFSEFGMTKDKVPICMFWLGTQPPALVDEAKSKGTALPSLHSPFFKPIPEPTIATGVKAMTSIVLGLLPAN
jgi:hippurate hydrolase